MSQLTATQRGEERFLLCEEGAPDLSVRRAPTAGKSVLYVHGSTFPAGLSINYRIDGLSWADDLQARGFDVWSFDLPGYGDSESDPIMRRHQVSREQVPGRATDAAHQIERMASHIRRETNSPNLSIIAHSWGTIAAGLFAGMRPNWVDRLVLFGPIAQRYGAPRQTGAAAPSTLISAADQWQSFQSRVPEDSPVPISKQRFDVWAGAYLATDPKSAERAPPSVKIPAGPELDFADSWSGNFPYDPATVRSPTLIVYGEWDSITRDADASWLAGTMTNVPGRARMAKLPRGAHRMHLEDNRQALFDMVGEFLAEATS